MHFWPVSPFDDLYHIWKNLMTYFERLSSSLMRSWRFSNPSQNILSLTFGMTRPVCVLCQMCPNSFKNVSGDHKLAMSNFFNTFGTITGCLRIHCSWNERINRYFPWSSRKFKLKSFKKPNAFHTWNNWMFASLVRSVKTSEWGNIHLCTVLVD